MQLELHAKVPSHTAEMESKFTGFQKATTMECAPLPPMKDDHPDHTFKSKRMLRLQTLSACVRRMKAARKSQMSQVAIRLDNGMIICTNALQQLYHSAFWGGGRYNIGSSSIILYRIGFEYTATSMPQRISIYGMIKFFMKGCSLAY